MDAQGLFFLRAPVCTAMTADRTPVLLLALYEREGLELQRLVAVWGGADAQAFYAAHGHIKAGTALRLQLRHLRCLHNEIHAHVTACALAPERWPGGHHPPSQPSPQEQPA